MNVDGESVDEKTSKYPVFDENETTMITVLCGLQMTP